MPICAARDKDALVTLYSATDGVNWRRNGNWLSEEPTFEWDGVTTNGNGCVTQLSPPGTS